MKQIKYCTIGLFTIISVIAEVSLFNENNQPRRQSNGKQKGMRYYDKRNIEGIKANYADYPFIVSLLYNRNHTCGGSMITNKLILTAAHCFYDPLGGYYISKSVSVAIGSSKWKSARKFKVKKIINHEQFNPSTFINDIAILVLRNKLSNRDNVAVIKLNSAPLNDNVKRIHATVVGWGFTSENGLLAPEASEDLYMVNIYSVPLRECKKNYNYIGGGQLCFSSPHRRGSCTGDSGGPLVMKKGSELVQIGLVSFGEDCNSTKPEVYTRISAFYPWIKNIMYSAKKKNW